MQKSENSTSLSHLISELDDDRSRNDKNGAPNRMPRVLLISPVETYRSALAINLRTQGFDIIEMDDPVELGEKIDGDGSIDAALIDTDALSAENAALLDQLCALSTRFPVAFVSTSCGGSREEVALNNGAADFLSKSRSPTIVGMRLRLLTEQIKVYRETQPAEKELQVGPLHLKLKSYRALWHNRQVPLTVTEFKIVRLLAGRAGENIAYREIYDVVHGKGFMAGEGPNGYRINVRSLIRKVRNRFRSIDKTFSEIENFAGYGYRWRSSNAESNASAGKINEKALMNSDLMNIAS